ncbi:hypothetical protein [Streptomyces sp. NPDC096030]|uniref:hypothetical protein n=1 Tax=Streptomyces sp. NPDC096030 TaxID=3155423 RepID=UPI0033192DDA
MSMTRYPAIQGEFEEEFEGEFENELEHEFEEEYEGETEGEWEWEGEGELETEWEEELESEAEGEYEYEAEFEAEYEFEFEAEAEAEEESEGFVNPVRRIYPDAELMAHLGRAACRTRSEAEAEAFIGAMVPLAARLIPRAARLVSRVAPQLIRGVAQVTRQLRRDPATRQLVEAVPVILQRTAQSIADQVQSGRPLNGDMAVRTLGRMTQRVLGSPSSRRRARNAVRVFDARRHARLRSGTAPRISSASPKRVRALTNGRGRVRGC